MFTWHGIREDEIHQVVGRINLFVWLFHLLRFIHVLFSTFELVLDIAAVHHFTIEKVSSVPSLLQHA